MQIKSYNTIAPFIITYNIKNYCYYLYYIYSLLPIINIIIIIELLTCLNFYMLYKF